MQKGDKSFYYPLFQIWPKECDILMNWNEEEFEYLQDNTLKEDVI